MSVKKFNAFKLKNEEVVNDLIQLIKEDAAHVEMFHNLFNSFEKSYATKLNKAFNLLKDTNMIQIVEKPFTSKKLCNVTSMLLETTEVRKYYKFGGCQLWKR